MDWTFLLIVAVACAVFAIGWERWPGKIAPAHEVFRNQATDVPVYRQDRASGKLRLTGVTLNSAEVNFSGNATFVLIPPMIQSAGLARIDSDAIMRVKAVTRYPTLRSYFVVVEQ